MHHRGIIFITLLIVHIMLSAAQVRAIGTPEEQGEDVFDLGEVVVSSSALDAMEAAETVHEISAAEIKRSGARTIDEALVLQSDVNIQVGNEAVPRVNIRGFRSRHVLLLLDGVPMNSSFDQQFDPSTIPTENIQQIKVTAGASSVLYGQGGLGGVVNIITKKGQEGLNGTLGYEYGDGQPYLGRATISGSRGKFDFFLSGSTFKRDHFPLAKNFDASTEEAEGYRKNSDSRRDNAFLHLGYTHSQDLYISMAANWVQGEYGKPASAIDNRFDPYAPPAKFGRVDWYGGHTFQLSADYSASKEFSLRSMVYYNRIDQDNNQYDNENYDTIDDIFVPNSYKLRNTGLNRGFSLQPRYDFAGFGVVTLGLSGEWDTWKDSGEVKTGGDSGAQGGHGIGGGSPPYVLYPVSDNKDLRICSAAIEYSVNPVRDLGLAAGFASHWQLRDEENTDAYSVSASAYYDLFPGTRIKSAFMRNIRFPSLSQLYLRDSDNPDLKTEVVYHYQAGIEQRLPWKSMLRLEGFRSDAHDFIALNQNVTPAKNTNFSLYRFYGFETSMETGPVDGLKLKGSYTRLISRDLSDVGRDEVQYVPRDKLTLTAKHDFDFGLSCFVSYIYVANSYVYSKQRIATVLKATMADYELVNARLSQKVYKDKLLFYVGADNIFNVEYEQSYGIPRPGRFIFGGIEYRYSI